MVLLLLGAAIALALIYFDPAALVFLLDADFLVTLASVGLLMCAAQLRTVWTAVTTSVSRSSWGGRVAEDEGLH